MLPAAMSSSELSPLSHEMNQTGQSCLGPQGEVSSRMLGPPTHTLARASPTLRQTPGLAHQPTQVMNSKGLAPKPLKPMLQPQIQPVPAAES